MRIAVVGSGGLGGYYGGQLARAGHDVVFLTRGPAIEAIRRNGLIVRSALSGNYTVYPQVTDTVDDLGTPDLILFTTKNYDLDEAAAAIAPAVAERTGVVTVQNGISHIDRLARYMPRERIIPGVIVISSTVVEPGVIEQSAGTGKITIGEDSGGITPRIEEIAGVFAGSGVLTETSEKIWDVLWRKFMIICAMSGVSALTRLTLQEVFAVPESRELYLAVMEEVSDVARASGIDLSRADARRELESIETSPTAPRRGSMAVDLMAGRRMELDVLNGAVVEYGRRLAVDTPMNLAIYRALKPYIDGRLPAG